MQIETRWFLYSKTRGYYLGRERGFEMCCDLEQQVPLWALKRHAEMISEAYDIPDIEILSLNTNARSIRLGDTLLAGMTREDFGGLI